MINSHLDSEPSFGRVFFLVFLTLFSFSIFSAIHSDTMCIWSGFTFRSIYNIFQVASVLLVKTKMSALCEAFVEKAVATPPSPARRAMLVLPLRNILSSSAYNNMCQL